jgi:aspartate racemase
MKTIGIIGGLGPEATGDYYKAIIRQVGKSKGQQDLNNPEIVIYSVNMAHFIGLLEKEDFEGAATYIAGSIRKLEAAGAAFAAISANTPHLLFNEIEQQTGIPLISIVESCKSRAKEKGLKRCGLLGTKFTMKSNFYLDVFMNEQIEVVCPNKDEIEIINDYLFNELELGIFKDETREALLGIVSRMIEEEHIDSMILGCTEFPMLFTSESYLNIPFLNTSQIHVEMIVEACLREL